MKNILVTGVSQGLGLNIARAILAAGWTVFGVSRRLSDEYRTLQERWPHQARFFHFDLGQPDLVHRELFGKFVTFEVPLHGFVNNAATAYDDIVTNLDAKRLRDMYEVNVISPMIITKCAIRNMLVNQLAGSIVHISSITVHTGSKGLAMYASSKGALEAFSKNTAREWGERGIRSNCVIAGFMETAMSAGLTEEQRNSVYRRTALKQAVQLESVSAAVVFLLGDQANSITGHNTFVDAGTI